AVLLLPLTRSSCLSILSYSYSTPLLEVNKWGAKRFWRRLLSPAYICCGIKKGRPIRRPLCKALRKLRFTYLLISTRRFNTRPSSVAFDAIGADSPNALTVILEASTPELTKYCFTELARSRDKFML